MALGRISGPLLKSNLLRNGVDLAFETNLLYLDVTNRRVGINTSTPSNDLQVVGTTRTSNLNASGTSTLGTISFSSNNITSTSNTINLTASGANPVVYQGTLQVGNLQLATNTISTLSANQNIVFTTTGTGAVTVNSNLTVTGNLNTQGNMFVGGNVTIAGTIQIGNNSGTDTVAITAGVNSNILPATTNTYNLGSNSLQWANVYANNLTLGTFTATNFTTANLTFSNGTITNTLANQDISLVTNGSGGINIGNFKINGNSITNTVSNAVSTFTQQVSNASFVGSISTQNTTTFSGSVSSNILTVSTAPNNGLGGSLQFSGSNYLTLGTPITVGAQAFTFECFFYCSSFSAIKTIIGSNVPGNGGFSIWLNNNTTIQIDRDGYDNSQFVFTTPFTTNAWHYLAVTKNASGQLMAFVDGVRSTSSYGLNSNYQGATSVIGLFNASFYFFTGQLAQLKFAVGTNYIDPTASSITVPVAPLTTSTNTKLLLNVASSGGYITDSSGIQTLTNTGSVSFNSANPFGASSGSIAIGQVISGGSIPVGTYIVSNISGTGTSSSSQWYINNYLTQLSTTITATPVVLNVTSVISGTILNNMLLSGGSLVSGTFITAFGTGSGGTGTYFVTPSQSIGSLTIAGSITGYVNIGGTNGVVIPAGTTSQRPATPIQGMVRFNSDPTTLAVEIYNGSSWTGVAGIQSGITVAQATDISAQWALTLG